MHGIGLQTAPHPGGALRRVLAPRGRVGPGVEEGRLWVTQIRLKEQNDFGFFWILRYFVLQDILYANIFRF